MALFVDGKSLQNENLGAAQLHLMPCTIEAESGDSDREAKVSEYFTPAIRKDEQGAGAGGGVYTSFRGRLLKGEDIKVPEGYKGLVLREPSKPFTEEEDRSLKATHSFDKLTYWNLETTPSSNDTIQRAMAWSQIASALHSPVAPLSPVESQGSVAGCR